MTTRPYCNVSDPRYDPNALFDVVMARRKLKNDAALAIELGVPAPTVSKIRSHAMPVGPTMLIRVHDVSGLSLNQIRAYLGMPTPEQPQVA
jgi:hypothetical protein